METHARIKPCCIKHAADVLAEREAVEVLTREKLHQLVHYRNEFKRLTATLRKCETAIDSLPPDALGIGGDGNKSDSTRWYLRDELLSEIREVLDGKRN